MPEVVGSRESPKAIHARAAPRGSATPERKAQKKAHHGEPVPSQNRHSDTQTFGDVVHRHCHSHDDAEGRILKGPEKYGYPLGKVVRCDGDPTEGCTLKQTGPTHISGNQRLWELATPPPSPPRCRLGSVCRHRCCLTAKNPPLGNQIRAASLFQRHVRMQVFSSFRCGEKEHILHRGQREGSPMSWTRRCHQRRQTSRR